MLLHLDDGKGGQLVGVDQVVELGGQNIISVTKLTITKLQPVPRGKMEIIKLPHQIFQLTTPGRCSGL